MKKLKYLPVWVSLLLGLAGTLFTGSLKAMVVMAAMAVFQYMAADKPLKKWQFHAYVLAAAILTSLAVYMVFVYAWAAFAIAGAASLLPYSVILTHEVEQ